MTPETSIVVHIVDDDAALRDSLAWLLESHDMAIEEYRSADEFLRAYRPHPRACLLLDVRMPGMTGLELQDRLLQKGIDVPTVFITAHGDVPMAVEAIRKGALDFLEKPFDEEQLLAAIRRAAQGREPTPRKADAAFLQRLATLGAREREILDLVVTGKLNKIIAIELGISIKTVERHRKLAMVKLQVTSLADLVKRMLSAG